jgi:hypothetical protein
MAKYYNGILLPDIPEDVLAEYPYCWIRRDGSKKNYDLIFGKQPWYFNGMTAIVCEGEKLYYSIPIETASDATEWTNETHTSSNFAITSLYWVMWSNHDIPKGSATATGVYCFGSEPIPADRAEFVDLEYGIYTGFYQTSADQLYYSGSGSVVNYAIPVKNGCSYVITLNEIPVRFSCAFTTIDPSTIKATVDILNLLPNASLNAGNIFGFQAREDGWAVIYVSNNGTRPNVSIAEIVTAETPALVIGMAKINGVSLPISGGMVKVNGVVLPITGGMVKTGGVVTPITM